MDYVDYQKLAEQYASFLVAVGGISITVLAIVLTLRPEEESWRARLWSNSLKIKVNG
jgi:hypothetical protein